MEDALGLGKFKIQISRLAPLSQFRTRGGFELSYRLYPSWSDNLIALFHGIGADSRYLAVLASAIAQAGLATVVTPDLRGHGSSWGTSDDIKPTQIEEDWEELLIYIKSQRAVGRVWLAGHSLGGALALKILSSPAKSQYQGGLLIAPYLPMSFNIHREGWGGWITYDQLTKLVTVQKPVMFQTPEDKLTYSDAYMRAISPEPDFIKKLQEAPKIAIVVGEKDQIFFSERYSSLFGHLSQIVIEVFPNENHFSILAQTDSVNSILNVLKQNWFLA